MISQSGLLSSLEHRVTFAVVIGLMLLLSVACEKSKEPPNPDGAQTKPPATQDDLNLRIFHQHDIPPEIAIDVGTFSIDTDQKLSEVTDTSGKKRHYKVQNKDVLTKLIKVIRTDDGAILYQNFEAEGAKIEFTTESNNTITLEQEPADGKKALKLQSKENADLVSPTNGPPPPRTYRLHNDTYKIKSITIKENSSLNAPTLFSHKTSSGVPGQYPDRRYRVLIRVEK